MIRVLVGVSTPSEAETAIHLGAEIVEARAPDGEVLGAAEISAIVAAVGARRPTSAWLHPASTPDAVGAAASKVAGTGVDFIRIGFPPGGARRDAVRAMADQARPAELIAVVFADMEPDPVAVIPQLREAGFAAVVLDVAAAGERLIAHADSAALLRFVAAAHKAGLLAGFGGAVEPPDLPRLVALAPDLIALQRADPDIMAGLRDLLSPERPPSMAGDEGGTGQTSSMRVFVRDLVLPVQIGAYSHERGKEQRVRFDVTVDVGPAGAAPAGMGQVFSYDLITDGIAAIVAEGHVDFVETLAERIVAHVLREPRARRVTVRVEKLDLGPGGVGVEITAERPA